MEKRKQNHWVISCTNEDEEGFKTFCTEQFKCLSQNKPAAIPSHWQPLYCNVVPLQPFPNHPLNLKPLSKSQYDMRSFSAPWSPYFLVAIQSSSGHTCPSLPSGHIQVLSAAPSALNPSLSHSAAKPFTSSGAESVIRAAACSALGQKWPH